MQEQNVERAVSEIWALFRETDAMFKETDAKFRETDAKFKETDAKLKENADQIRRTERIFVSQWGRFIEELVKPDAVAVFRQRGIDVHYIYRRSEAKLDGRTMEVDLLLENDNEVVVIEVKSVLKVDDVQEFLEDLRIFTAFLPRFRGYRVYGAVAGLTIDENADRYAYKRGLFVVGMAASGMVEIKNDLGFRPRDFELVKEII